MGLIYLLAATMFRRRRIAILAGAFMALDAMSYVMSRISMNDIFVAAFIAAAYLVFWQVWSGRWQRSAWWALPLVGVLIGLASATKWVGIYALIGLWVLVLARSNLGRFLLVAGMASLTVVAGIDAPWPFLAVSLAAFALALLLVWIRPIRLDSRDLLGLAPTALVLSGIGLAFALAFDQVQGSGTADNSVELAFAVLARGAQVGWPAFLMLGVAAALLLLRAVVSLVRPESDRRWHLPGELGGFSWPWIGAALAVIPLLVYFLAYVPYLQLGHNIAGPDAGPGYGWSLEELHAQMFGYHFGLQAGHAAASPWWSWPLDLKPVWFYGHDFDGRTVGVIYNGGNPILFWAGVPAIAVLRGPGLAPPLHGPRAAGGRLRLPVPAVDADRARHVPVPLPDRGDVRHGGRRLRGGRGLAILELATAGHGLPGAGRRRRRAHLPAGQRHRHAGLVHQPGACPAAVELRVQVPGAAAGRARAAAERRHLEAGAGHGGRPRRRRLRPVRKGPMGCGSLHASPQNRTPADQDEPTA